jgi:phosphohistidine phosphatase
MKVYFLRHGIAADPEDFHGSDEERPLTAEGKDKMAREAKALANLRLKLDAIVTSPLLRAKQTADIVAKELGLRDKLNQDGRAGLEFDAATLAAILEKFPDDAAVMIVGHEPSMSQTIGHVIGGANVDLKKGGIACVEMAQPLDTAATLLWLAPPRILLQGG